MSSSQNAYPGGKDARKPLRVVEDEDEDEEEEGGEDTRECFCEV